MTVLKIVRTAAEVAHAALLTWLLFMAIQALTLHIIAEGF
jgi:hypothetical protein